MRNPDRIASFLNCITPFEGRILTNDVIHEVAVNLIGRKLYYTQQYEMKVPEYRAIFVDENRQFSRKQIEDIIRNSPQNHKEAGFEKGWPSRFDTWYKLPKEFGFLFYEMNEPIKISQTGHMLIDAYNEIPTNEKKVQNVMLNSMMKYQSNNPFRRNLNSNAPLLLLLNVLKKLKNDPSENGAGIFKQELSLLICWPNMDVDKLYKKIKQIRKKVGFTYSDEFMYNICLELLEAGEDKKNRFKMNQICDEAVDEYIRKMRSTGLISLRGNGRFIDFNSFEQEKINYVIDHYSSYSTCSDINSYYEYMGIIDNNILDIQESSKTDVAFIRKKALKKYAQEYSREQIFEELRKVCSKKESKDPLLKFINGPTRLEFLTSIALSQSFDGLDVNPNYSIDDEGLPTSTAGGGVADIECYDTLCDSFFEVTLMCGRSDQVNNEIIPIRRHLIEHISQNKNVDSFSVFIAPIIHEDTKESASWYKYKEKIDIIPYNIDEFISKITSIDSVYQFNTYKTQSVNN